MFTTRFPNRDQECFGCSLANYVELIREPSLADKVYRDFRKHPFVAENGTVNGGLGPRLVKELTEGIYQARLTCAETMPLEEEEFSELAAHLRRPALDAVIQDIETGRVRVGISEMEYRGPALLIKQGKVVNHWVVDCWDGYIVDNGKLILITDPEIFYSKIIGVLEIEKKSL